MKFRIIRNYDEFQPQVLMCDGPNCSWVDIGEYRCLTREAAKQVCADYKLMKENPVVEEFEL